MKTLSLRSARGIALTAILLAVTLILSAAESALMPNLPTGVRIGLANVTVMTAVLFINRGAGFILTVLKAAFVFLTRGAVAGAMSFAGGLCALIVIIILLRKTGCSYIFASVLGAIAHITAQLVLSHVITGSKYVYAYAPFLILTSIVCGILTGILLKAVTAAMAKIPIFTDIKALDSR
jgi:heptaprenyl diphosphate synthase